MPPGVGGPPGAPPLHALAVVPPAEALLRIEAVALALLQRGRVDFAEGDAPVVLDNGVLRQTARARSLRVESATLVKALHILALMHNVLSMGETCNVREVFYRNKQTSPEGSPTAVVNEAQCTRIIKTCGDLCGLTRESLGLCGADKGAFTGCVRWRTAPDEAWQSAYGATRTVPGVHADLSVEFEPELQRRARCVLVVEKHTVRRPRASSTLNNPRRNIEGVSSHRHERPRCPAALRRGDGPRLSRHCHSPLRAGARASARPARARSRGLQPVRAGDSPRVRARQRVHGALVPLCRPRAAPAGTVH